MHGLGEAYQHINQERTDCHFYKTFN